MPRVIARKSAEMRGDEVRFGVWMKIESLALVSKLRRKVFSGVGGGLGDEKKLK